MVPMLVETIFHHGEFKSSDVLPTAHALIAFASGLPVDTVLLKVVSTKFLRTEILKSYDRCSYLLDVKCEFKSHFNETLCPCRNLCSNGHFFLGLIFYSDDHLET